MNTLTTLATIADAGADLLVAAVRTAIRARSSWG